jgi:hypothetical protein
MSVEREGETTRVLLDPSEVKLLRHALERALFIDTPVREQEAIAHFGARLLEQLGQT